MRIVHILLIGGALYCQGIALANNNLCSSIKTPEKLIECSLANDPRIVQKKTSLGVQDGEIQRAKQRPNLEMELDGSHTKVFGSDRLQAEVRLLHTFELGGKRAARTSVAKNKKNMAQLQLKILKGQVKLENILKLHRYRQATEEYSAVKEILNTFKTVKRKFKSRASLSAEQTVSLEVFDLAEMDQSLKMSRLKVEMGEIERDLNLSTALTLKLDKEILLSSPSQWPDLPTLTKVLENSLDLRAAQVRTEQSKSQFEIERSAGWPNLSLGPSFGTEIENNDRFYTVGLSMVMPLPFYHQNQGGKTAALSQMKVAEVSKKNLQRRVEREFLRLSATYSNLRDTLKKMKERQSVHLRHKKIHGFISRGIVSGALVVESHRQLFDFIQHKNQIELSLIKLLWSSFLLEGSIIEKAI